MQIVKETLKYIVDEDDVCAITLIVINVLMTHTDLQVTPDYPAFSGGAAQVNVGLLLSVSSFLAASAAAGRKEIDTFGGA